MRFNKNILKRHVNEKYCMNNGREKKRTGKRVNILLLQFRLILGKTTEKPSNNTLDTYWHCRIKHVFKLPNYIAYRI